jgi:hypothetical protein
MAGLRVWRARARVAPPRPRPRPPAAAVSCLCPAPTAVVRRRTTRGDAHRACRPAVYRCCASILAPWKTARRKKP